MSTGNGPAPSVIGVAGAGTMGSGIAQLACQAGARTLLHDPDPEALERGIKRINDHLQRSADRGRMTPEQAESAATLLEPAPELQQLAPCELVIEAAPERLNIKRQLFASVADVVGPECVLATNTSSLLVTALADAAGDPSRVVGMHFFNPAPLMRLLEVVAGAESSQRALTVPASSSIAATAHSDSRR
jgi:3-hydroxybutyryl-CoA dehydrogenase